MSNVKALCDDRAIFEALNKARNGQDRLEDDEIVWQKSVQCFVQENDGLVGRCAICGRSAGANIQSGATYAVSSKRRSTSSSDLRFARMPWLWR
jgi:hypothetical protein